MMLLMKENTVGPLANPVGPRREPVGNGKAFVLATAFVVAAVVAGKAHGAGLWAGVAKVDITDRQAGRVDGPLYAKALMLRSAAATTVLITVDAVAIGEIG